MGCIINIHYVMSITLTLTIIEDGKEGDGGPKSLFTKNKLAMHVSRSMK